MQRCIDLLEMLLLLVMMMIAIIGVARGAVGAHAPQGREKNCLG